MAYNSIKVKEYQVASPENSSLEQRQTIGIVSLVPMGAWRSDVFYEKLNMVTYKQRTFISKRQNNGIAPLDAANWDEVWMELLFGGGSSEGVIPPFSAEDNGKILGVDQSTLKWLISVTKTSQLTNDGEGDSPFVSESFVAKEVEQSKVGMASEQFVEEKFEEAVSAIPKNTSDLSNNGDGTSPFVTEKSLEEATQDFATNQSVDEKVKALADTKGKPEGLAPLDARGKIPESLLPDLGSGIPELDLQAEDFNNPDKMREWELQYSEQNLLNFFLSPNFNNEYFVFGSSGKEKYEAVKTSAAVRFKYTNESGEVMLDIVFERFASDTIGTLISEALLGDFTANKRIVNYDLALRLSESGMNGETLNLPTEAEAPSRKTLTASSGSMSYDDSTHTLKITDADIKSGSHVDLYPDNAETETFLSVYLASNVLSAVAGSFTAQMSDEFQGSKIPTGFSAYYIITEVKS